VVFQLVPKDLQDVALGGFDATVHFATVKVLGACGHCGDTTLDGFFKGGDRPQRSTVQCSDSVLAQQDQGIDG